MTGEEKLLTALLAGPQPASSIPMPPRTRRRWASRLEQEGHLTRSGAIYSLTKSGKAYAIMLGLLSTQAPYYVDLTDDIADFDAPYELALPATGGALIEWLGTTLMIAALLATLMWVVMVWTRFIPQ